MLLFVPNPVPVHGVAPQFLPASFVELFQLDTCRTRQFRRNSPA
jgi:hypothetical protein